MERIVQCLSPVHIGTGKELEPFDYIVDGQRYIRVHLDAVLERMTPEQADDLATWVSQRADQIMELEERRAYGRERTQLNERISAIRREMQLLNFRGADAALQEALRKDAALARYQGSWGFERNLKVREQVKDADETPLIPGSSLKGALRTALAFARPKGNGAGRAAGVGTVARSEQCAKLKRRKRHRARAVIAPPSARTHRPRN